jgi:obg-like ATPase 1
LWFVFVAVLAKQQGSSPPVNLSTEAGGGSSLEKNSETARVPEKAQQTVSSKVSKASSKKGQASESVPRLGRVKNNLKMGIVGLPNVGKSSLFNILGDNAHADAANYPFCTIDPNETRCRVPDPRFEQLVEIFEPSSKIPAFLQLVDIAGLIKGASTGAGLGNAFLSHIQAVDGIFHMVRAFNAPEVIHVDDSVDPVRDLETITAELCAKDFTYLTGVKEAKANEMRRNPKIKRSTTYVDVMDKVTELLSSNSLVGKATWSSAEVACLNDELPLLITSKPIVYLVNVSKKDFIRGGNKFIGPIKSWVQSHGGGVVIPVSITLEAEIHNLRAAGDSAGLNALLRELPKGRNSMVPRIIKCGYRQLQLSYFFTAGEDEVRAWTIMKGVTAPQAAGVIHTDFERGFIKAECCLFDDFIATRNGAKSMAGARSAGKYRIEGKNYIVQDGDIIYFQFNVTSKKK